MRRTGIILAIALLFGSAVQATQVLFRSPQQLGQEAAVVVQGRVTAVESYWNPTRTEILTETRIAVDETFKGSAGSEVRIIQLGGTVGNVRVSVHGALQWLPDEEVVVFLEPAAAGAYHVAGFTQGKFNVERDDRGRAYVVRPVSSDQQLAGGAADAPATARTRRVSVQRFVDDALASAAKGGDQR